MRMLDRVLTFIMFVASAGVIAFLASMLTGPGLAIPPAQPGIDTFFFASALGVMLFIVLVEPHED
ncbi:MAG: hypothetical protein PS018_19835 [bacterium]|nr:hypothetical protein [bacterium]